MSGQIETEQKFIMIGIVRGVEVLAKVIIGGEQEGFVTSAEARGSGKSPPL